MTEFTMRQMIATLSALSHEIQRTRKKLEGEISDDEGEELGYFLQDLLDARGTVADAYETKRADSTEFTEVELLLSYLENQDE